MKCWITTNNPIFQIESWLGGGAARAGVIRHQYAVELFPLITTDDFLSELINSQLKFSSAGQHPQIFLNVGFGFILIFFLLRKILFFSEKKQLFKWRLPLYCVCWCWCWWWCCVERWNWCGWRAHVVRVEARWNLTSPYIPVHLWHDDDEDDDGDGDDEPPYISLSTFDTLSSSVP